MFKKMLSLSVCLLTVQSSFAQEQFQAWNPLDPNQPANIEFEQRRRYEELFDSKARQMLRQHELRSQIHIEAVEEVSTPLIIKNEVFTQKKFQEITHPSYQHPGNAAVFLLFRLPNRFRTGDSPSNSVSFTSTAANTMIHPAVLEKHNGDRRYQYVDHLGNMNELSLSLGDEVQQIQLSLRVLDVAGSSKNNLTLYPVSDKVIEKIHQWNGHNDPYARKEAGLDRVVVDLRDTDGNSMNLSDGETYVLPLVVDYSVFKKLFQSDKQLLTVNAGVQGQVPVSQTFNQAGAGTYANLSFTRKVAREWLLNFALGLGTNLQKNLSGGYKPYDGNVDVSFNSNVSIGLTRVDQDLKGKTSLVAFGTQYSSVLDEKDYTENNQGRFINRQSRYAMFRPDRRFGVALIRENQDMIIQLQVAEDYIDSKNKMNGLNHEDFQVSIRVSKKI